MKYFFTQVKSHLVVALLAAAILIISLIAAASISINSATSPSVSAAQVDYFLKIEGIDGESRDDKHRGEIDILSWSWGMSQPGAGTGSTRRRGNVVVEDVTLSRSVDKASPALMLKCASGEHIEKLELAAKKPGATDDYYTVTFEDCNCTSFNQSAGGGEEPVESVSFTYSKVKVEYKPQNDDGSLGDPIIAEWNFEGGRAL